MSTPAAVAVYSEAGPQPRVVTERRWRGVYHHWIGDLDELGNLLVERVQERGGDLTRVVRELIDEAPHGWSNLSEDERYGSDDPGPEVTVEDTGSVIFVYVFDVEGRRLDAFGAAHSGGTGERIASVSFAVDGTPTPPTLDFHPLESVVEEPLEGGERLSAEGLHAMLKGLPRIGNERYTLEWFRSSESPGGSLMTIFHVVEWEDGEMVNIVEREVELVPRSVRSEPRRVQNYLNALAGVADQHLSLESAFGLLSKNPLARTRARSEETFRRLLLTRTYLG